MELFVKPKGVKTRWASFENPTAAKGQGGRENKGAKGHACDNIRAGQTVTLMEAKGSGLIQRIWMTCEHRSPNALRSLRLDAYWDGCETPAVSAPLGDFFGVGLGRQAAFESELFSSPQGRSFNCFVPMPFFKSARITVTNESNQDSTHFFYDVDFLTDVTHAPGTLYFHTHWRREKLNQLGHDFDLIPTVRGSGKYLGCNVGVITNPVYGDAWWGEGEAKVWLDGDGEFPTLCGTGAEDYIGTGWGLGFYSHRSQGCTIADAEKRQWCFYRYHTVDSVYFDESCRVAVQTIGGTAIEAVAKMRDDGAPLIPVTAQSGPTFIPLLARPQPVDLRDPTLAKWCNFYRQDDWSSTAYFYLDRPGNDLPAIAPVAERLVEAS